MNSVELHSSNVLLETDGKGIKMELCDLNDTESQASSNYVQETYNMESYIKKEDCESEVCVKSETEDGEFEELIIKDLVDQYMNGSNVQSTSKADIDRERQCNSQTFPENDSKIHMPKHNQSTVNKMFGSPCNISNEREDHLQAHTSQHLHNGFSNIEKFTVTSKNKPNFKSSQRQARPRSHIFICHICSHQFKSQDNLKEHIENHGHQPQAGAFSQQDTHIRTKGLIHTYENFECTKCNFSSKSLKFLKRHISVEHEDEEGYSCRDCGQVFARKSVFQKHEQRHRDGHHIKTNQLSHKSKKLKCKKCDLSSNSKSSLDNYSPVHGDQAEHIENHTYKNFDCTKCNFSSRSLTILKRHISVQHKGRKRYSCLDCGQVFTRKKVFQKHERTHREGRHIDTNQLSHKSKKFKCNKCDYSSNSKSSLDNHSQVHTAFKRQNVFQKLKQVYRYIPIVKDRPLKRKPIQLPPDTGKFKCQYCNYLNQCEDLVRKHVLKHMDLSEIAEYKCTLCEKQITATSELTHDACMHLDSRCQIFECKLCNYQRKRLHNIREHIAKNHVDTTNYIRVDD